jgi:hypothetical protein
MPVLWGQAVGVWRVAPQTLGFSPSALGNRFGEFRSRLILGVITGFPDFRAVVLGLLTIGDVPESTTYVTFSCQVSIFCS